MKKLIFVIIGLTVLHIQLFGQSTRKKVESGNVLYYQEKYDEALNKYQDALIDNPESPEINFNVGNSQYKMKKYDESLKEYEKLLTVPDAMFQSKVYYNIGNTLFRSGKIAECILSYKKALELNPDDIDAKFNLEFARNFLKEHAEKEPMPQQQQQQLGEQEDTRQSSEDDEQEKSENQKDKQIAEKDDSEQKEDEKEEISKEEAESILRALENDEKKNLKDAKKMKIPGNVRVLKDW